MGFRRRWKLGRWACEGWVVREFGGTGNERWVAGSRGDCGFGFGLVVFYGEGHGTLGR